MEKTNLTNEQLVAILSPYAVTNAIKGLSLAQSLKEELVDFISQSTGESKGEIIKRVDLREKKIRLNLAKSIEDRIIALDEQIYHGQQNDDSTI